MRVTIKSIAEAANVSRGTVDKVLNKRPGVSKSVREKVLKIAEDMGYRPNIAGKALAFQKKPIKIGVIILNKEDPLFGRVLLGVKKASQEFGCFGINVKYVVMKKVNWQEQLNCIEELEKMNVEALVLSPVNEDIIRKKINELVAKKIKIVTYNTELPGINRMFYVGQNTIKGGRVAGDLIGKLLPNGGNVMLISGPDKLKGLEDRATGFEEVIHNEYPLLKITHKVKTVGTNESAYKETKKVLMEDDAIHAIYITGRGVGGVGKAMISLGKENVHFICHDKMSETMTYLSNDIVDFTITQEPMMQGYLPIKILFEYYFHEKDPDDEYIYTKLEIVSKENMTDR